MTSRIESRQPPAPRMRIYLLSSLRSQAGLLISRRNLLELQNHPSALTCLESGSDLPLRALQGLGHPHHPPLAAHVSARPPMGGGVSNASESRKAAG